MKPQELNAVLQRIEGFWPSIFRDKPVVFAEWRKRLDNHSVEAGANAVNCLIETKRVGIPSVAELLDFLPRQTKAVENNCKICDGTGWIMSGTSKKGEHHFEFVNDCVCTPRPDVVKESDSQYTRKVRQVGTLGEAKEAFDRGLTDTF